MKLALSCVLGFLAFPGVAADTAAPADPQLLRLEQDLSEKLAIKKEGRIAPEVYLAWETKFRENLGAAMSRAKPSPDNRAAHARITALLGEKGEAHASLDRALENDPDSPVLLRTKSQLQLEQGDFPGAAENAWAAYEKSGRTDMAALALHHTAKNRRTPSAVSAPPPSADSVPASVANDSNKPYRLAVKGKATPTEVPAVVRPESTNPEENRGGGLSLVTKLGIAAGILMLVWGGTPQETKDRLKHNLWEQPKQELKTLVIVGGAAGAMYLAAPYIPPLLATLGPSAPTGMMPALAGGGTTGGGIALQHAVVGTAKAAVLAGGGAAILKNSGDNVSFSKSDEVKKPQPQDETARGVEFYNDKRSPTGEFDEVDVQRGLFTENKSAKGLGTTNPNTGAPNQTAKQWAEKQIFDKTVRRIEGFKRAVGTRPTKGGSDVVPSIEKIRNIRKLRFRVESTSAEAKIAVAEALRRLNERYPDWTFSAIFGP